MSTHTLKAARIAFVIATIAVNGMPSYAFAGETVPKVEVRYSDLDLKTEAGVATLDHRLSLAIRRVCYLTDPNSTWEMAEESRCRKQARAEIQPQRELAISNARSQSRFATVDRATVDRGMQVADRAPIPGADH